MNIAMSATAIYYPVFAQVILTFALLYGTGRVRVAAIKKGETRVKDIALGQNAWPARATQFANAYNNQFQLPVLFYTVVILSLVSGPVDRILVALAWGFVVMRLVHAWIYVTTNNVSQRFNAFVAGLVFLATMWGYFAFILIAAGR